MTRSTLLAAVLAATGGAAAWASDPLMPQSDFRMVATMQEDGSQLVLDTEMRHSNGRFRMETEFQGQSATVLIDTAADTVTILMNMGGMRMAMDVPPQDADFDVPMADEHLGDPVGTDIVAGEPCTIYRIEDADVSGGEAEGCLTDDYIVLRVVSPEHGTVFEAREFERAHQEDRWFTVPDGYRRMDMGGLGGLSGMFQ
jgi:hypothetical protein